MSQVGSGREQLLSKAFVGLADTLVDDYDVIELLDRLVGYSVKLLAAEAAGILLADSQRILATQPVQAAPGFNLIPGELCRSVRVSESRVPVPRKSLS